MSDTPTAPTAELQRAYDAMSIDDALAHIRTMIARKRHRAEQIGRTYPGPHAHDANEAAALMRLDSLTAEHARLREAATAFADKIDEIGPKLNGVFTIAMIHGCPYDGPTWTDALNDLRAALTRPPQEDRT